MDTIDVKARGLRAAASDLGKAISFPVKAKKNFWQKPTAKNEFFNNNNNNNKHTVIYRHLQENQNSSGLQTI